ncbi:hypothetical protein FQA39_LY01921 [Lamprigera yunnana]|nr:hypothetical protein FQA39_LY01921 [Lamprigera yunnana]
MVSRSQKILQLLKNEKDVHLDSEIMVTKNFERCNDENLKDMVVQSETTTNNNNDNYDLETTDEAKNVKTSTILKPINSEHALDLKKKNKKEFLVKEKNSRKRMKNESEWKKKKQAIARGKGEAYISYKGKITHGKNRVSTDLVTNVG